MNKHVNQMRFPVLRLVLLVSFMLSAVGVYIFTVAQHREAVAQLKAVEKQYAEYRARQERMLKYQAEYARRLSAPQTR